MALEKKQRFCHPNVQEFGQNQALNTHIFRIRIFEMLVEAAPQNPFATVAENVPGQKMGRYLWREAFLFVAIRLAAPETWPGTGGFGQMNLAGNPCPNLVAILCTRLSDFIQSVLAG